MERHIKLRNVEYDNQIRNLTRLRSRSAVQRGTMREPDSFKWRLFGDPKTNLYDQQLEDYDVMDMVGHVEDPGPIEQPRNDEDTMRMLRESARNYETAINAIRAREEEHEEQDETDRHALDRYESASDQERVDRFHLVPHVLPLWL